MEQNPVILTGGYAVNVGAAGLYRRRIKMETVQQILENEAVLFYALIALIGLTALWFDYIIRRWSWIPRKRQRKNFGERW